jgi:hypothetical protein
MHNKYLNNNTKQIEWKITNTLTTIPNKSNGTKIVQETVPLLMSCDRPIGCNRFHINKKYLEKIFLWKTIKSISNTVKLPQKR